MNYNTQREHINIREYGRLTQNLVAKMQKETNREKRNDMARLAVEVMTIVTQSSANKQNDEFQHKLWDHLYVIADWDLDIDSPYGVPNREEAEARPDALPYSKHKIAHRHYGLYVEEMVQNAKAEKDPEKQKAYAEVIANYMKLAAQNWGREGSGQNDDFIKADLVKISGGKLTVAPEIALDMLASAVVRRPQQQQQQRRHQGGGKNRRNFRGNNRHR